MPSEVQLGRYVSRFSRDRSRVLATISDSTTAWAREVLPESIDGLPVDHLSWDDIRGLVRSAMSTASSTERL